MEKKGQNLRRKKTDKTKQNKTKLKLLVCTAHRMRFSLGYPDVVEELHHLPVEGHGDGNLECDPGEPGGHPAVEGRDALVLEHLARAVHGGFVLG